MTRIGMEAKVVAAGMRPDGKSVRAVVLLCPVFPGEGYQVDLEQWPREGHRILDALDHLYAYPHKRSGDSVRLPLKLAGKKLSAQARDDREPLNRLWQRLMAPGGSADWDALFRNWCLKPGEGSADLRPVLPLPTAEAGLAYPLERGRKLLEELAPSNSPLLAQATTRPDARLLSAVGRPWLGEPSALTRLASLRTDAVSDSDATLLLGAPDLAALLRDPASHSTLADYLAPDDPQSLVAVAAGINGADMLKVFDRIHTGFHLVNGYGEEETERAPKEEDSKAPLRRQAQLMGSPAMLRLFGFARDVVIALPDELLAHYDSYWRLDDVFSNAADAGTLRTRPSAAKLWLYPPNLPGVVGAYKGFWPVPRSEWHKGVTDDQPEVDGIVRLGRSGQRLFALTSLESALAIESDRALEIAQQAESRTSSRPPSLVTDGLDLLRFGKRSEAKPVDPALDYAEELSSFERLDIGTDVDEPIAGTVWLSTMNRRIALSDPKPEGGRPTNWVDGIVDWLLGDAMERYELDAATVTEARIEQLVGPSATLCEWMDGRVTRWSGSSAGVAADQIRDDKDNKKLSWRGDITEIEHKDGIVSAIALNQDLFLPARSRVDLLQPQLRLGWNYRVGLRRVFVGGASIPVAEVAESYGAPFACIPPASEPGYRFLRHEALPPPATFLAPGTIADRNTPSGRLQTPASAIVVTIGGNAQIDRTMRLLTPPAMPLEFVMLHGVVDDLPEVGTFLPVQAAADRAQVMNIEVRRPRDGLGLLDLADPALLSPGPTEEPQLRFRPEVPWEDPSFAQARPVPYWPDPAAGNLVLALRTHAGAEDWLGPPVVLSLRPHPDEKSEVGDLRWPDVVPVHLTVTTGPATGRSPRLTLARGRHGLRRMTEDGSLVDPAELPADPFHPARLRGLPVRAVTVSLAAGEQVELVSWFAPSKNDLASWFDVVEKAREIAEQHGRSMGARSTEDACRAGLTRLLGVAAGHPNPGQEPVEHIASRLHQRLLEGPLPLLCGVRVIELAHLTDRPAVQLGLAAPKTPGAPAIVRRLDTTPDALRAYLGEAGLSDRWDGRGDERGAVATVLGGEFQIEPATTSGVIVTAQLVAPGDVPIDQGSPGSSPNLVPGALPLPAFRVERDGAIDLTPLEREVEVLRIEDIPPPRDGRHGPVKFRLEDLQAQALGAPGPKQDGRPKIVHSPMQLRGDGAARRLRLSMQGIPRHRARLEDAGFKPPPLAAPGVRQTLQMAATIRPTPPSVREIVPVLKWQSAGPSTMGPGSWALQRDASLRILLNRPWFSSGEDERLGIVIWPPDPLRQADPAAPALTGADLGMLVEEDLGPLGRFVSGWGRDPIRAWNKSAGRPSIFLARDDFVAAGAEWQSHVLMPVPPSVPGQGDEQYAAVSLITLAPRFNSGADSSWFADVDIDVGGVPDAFVRLGLVRFQPHAIADRLAMPIGVRCSQPTAAWAQILPRRHVAISCTPHRLARRSVLEVGVKLSGAGSTRAGRHELLPRTGVRMAIVRDVGNREEVAQGPDGQLLDVTNEQADPGAIRAAGSAVGQLSPILTVSETNTDVSWTAIFHLPAGAQDTLGEYAVIVEEYDVMPASTEPYPRRVGVRCFARQPLI